MWGALRKPYQGETYALGSTVCAGGRRGRFGVPRGDSAHHPLLHAGRQEGQGTCRGCGGPHRRVDRRGSRVEYAGFRIGSGLRGSNARVGRLRGSKVVDDRRGGRDIGSNGTYGFCSRYN